MNIIHKLTIIAILTIIPFQITFAGPHRVVSLSPSTTKTIADLGHGSSIVGITNFCQKPENANQTEVVGTLTSPNIEKIIALRPTVIFADKGSNRKNVVLKLESLGMHVVRLGPYQNFDDILETVRVVADELDSQDRAKQIILESQQRLENVKTKIENHPPKKVFIEIWPKPLKTVSANGFVHSVFERAGGINVFADSPIAYPNVSLEAVIAKQPEMIAILTHSLIDDKRVNQYKQNPAFDVVNVFQLDSSEITQPNILNFVNAVETVAEHLHPEINIESNLSKASTNTP